MKLLFVPAYYSDAERQCLAWLGERAKWLTVRVRRVSKREFDLAIEGEYDADDGFDYTMPASAKEQLRGFLDGTTTGNSNPITIQRTRRGFAKVRPRKFSSWLPLACLHEFWALGLHAPTHGDWSFTRDMVQAEQWREFERIVNNAKILARVK